jgi:hypothetical protein
MHHRHLVLVGLVLAAACNRDSKAPPAPPPPAPHEVAHAAAAATLDRAAAEEPAAAAAMQTIAGRLQYEASHRPAGTAKAEDVLAALAKAGLPLADGPRQYLGKVIGAEFCMGGTTDDGLAVSVCEYASPAAAAAGKAAVEQRFADLTPVRDIVVRGATTLTLTGRPDAPLADRRRSAAEAFSTL